MKGIIKMVHLTKSLRI